MERKLTAILSADVKGYSRLMGDNEEATIRTLTAYREVMTTLIQQHRGRVVDATGDNLLAEFASAVDAVQSAVEIQRELKAKNADLADARKMEYRIGINVGDVIFRRRATVWRRSEYCGAVGKLSRAGRDLHRGDGVRPGREQACPRL